MVTQDTVSLSLLQNLFWVGGVSFDSISNTRQLDTVAIITHRRAKHAAHAGDGSNTHAGILVGKEWPYDPSTSGEIALAQVFIRCVAY